LISAPGLGGWWSKYDDFDNGAWCHRLDDVKYCLPNSFKLERAEDSHLTFVDKGPDRLAIYAVFMGSDAVDEFLAGWSATDETLVQSDVFIKELRLIRLRPVKEDRDFLLTLVVFPDGSFVQIASYSSRVEKAIDALMEPVRIK
jgi:hypothetical protein